ncbi:Retrovirus-related Pol poly, partial [Paramuricea clavata]
MEKTFTLSQILDYGRALARTDQQTKEIIKKDISDGNEEHTNQLQQDHRRPRTTSKYSSSSSKRCFKCGLGFPHKDNQKCPAVDKECYKCHKRGHFARVCKTTGGAPSSFQRVNKVDERHSSTHKSTTSQYDKLLSNTTAQQLRLIKLDLNSVSQQAVQEEEYADVFEGVGHLKGFEQKLHIDSVPLAAQTYPRIPFNLRPQKRLPFGINLAGEVFQNAIKHALQGLNGVKNIVDHIIVWGRTQKEHDDNLQALLQRLRDTGLTAKKSNCLFNVDSLWFYGTIASKNGIRPDQEKVVAIKNTSAPNNVKELRSFLGLVNYCSKFIPNFSTIPAALRKLDRKKVPWTWDASHQETFDQVKSSRSEQCTLAYYDPNRSTSVVVDASSVGLRDILVQHDEQGILKVIAFAIGCQFTLYTDHQALEILYSAKAKQSARIQRWALRLQQTLALAHRRHLGIVKTKQNLRTKVWWPRLDKQAEQHVKECLTCQISGNPEPPPPLAVIPPPMAPWSCIHVDFYGPAPTGEHLLVLLDETTGFPEVEIMNKTTAFHTIRAFEKVFARHGQWKSGRLHETYAAEKVLKRKDKSKQYVDARRHTRKSAIREGDTVLVKQKKKNKYTTMFRPQPYKVINVRYSRVTAQRGDHVITRNISHFKKFSGAYRETVLKPESEDDITIAAPQAGQDNDQDIIEDRYPLRANKGVLPDFYGR